jgi:hypothetical protein
MTKTYYKNQKLIVKMRLNLFNKKKYKIKKFKENNLY